MAPELITVFGGTGFLGRTVVRHLLESGATVRIAARHPRIPDFAKADEQTELQTADVRDEASVANAVNGATGVVNAVGLYVERGKATFNAVHVEGARQIARQVRQAGIRRLVHISGIGANPVSPSKYVRARALGEQQVQGAFAHAVILRPSVLFGPGGGFLGALQTVTRLPVVPLFGRGTVRLQPVYVEDVAKAVLRALEMPEAAGTTFELGGADIYRYRDILEQVLAHYNRRRLLLPIPFSVWKLLAKMVSILPNPPLTVDQVILMQTDNVVGRGVRTFTDLGIEPSSLAQKLAYCLDEPRH